MWTFHPKSYFSSCNNSAVGLIDAIKLFIDYIQLPFLSAVKETSFTLVSTFEYPYPITVFCYSAIFEVIEDLDSRATIFIKRPGKLIENLMRYMGSILKNLMIAPDCLKTLDGLCFGQNLGVAINYIFNP